MIYPNKSGILIVGRSQEGVSTMFYFLKKIKLILKYNDEIQE